MSNSACGTQSLYNLSIADRTRNRERSCLLLWYLQYLIVENAVIIEPIVLLNLKPTITVRRAAALGHIVIIIYYAHLVVPGRKFWKVWIGSGGEQQLDHGMI